ncbi:E3 binding domain-containing protein, partial [Salmonella enterica]|uniref:E3 binding domain-containing protein n=1 Tax=Salmonella enterica TaxID=28901 RepID=UPI0039E9E470
HGIDVKALQGSGPGGRVIKRDVQQAIEAQRETQAAVPPAARAQPREGVSDIAVRATPVGPGMIMAAPSSDIKPGLVPLSNMRLTIAKRL